jgi:SRSO17 transposase
VAGHLGDPGGVLVVDETGFLKKGTKFCGVARQYNGTAGRIENCQVGVFLGYATSKGRALLDRTLYLPKEWTDDRPRCRAAGVPDAVGFATKLELARRMVDRALDAVVPAKWVTGDAVYGSGYTFRAALERRGLGYVLGVRTDQAVCVGWRQREVRSLLAEVPAAGWHRLGCGNGSKGPRVYDWAVCPVNCPEPRRYVRWLLIRRSVADPSAMAYSLCGGPPGMPLGELVRVSGARWAIEECFELAKGECGRDEFAVRSWVGWHRHVTLSLLAPAVVADIRSRAARAPRKRGAAELIPLTAPEVRRVILRLVWGRLAPAEQVLAWSAWRRRHQHRARRSHYRRRGARPPK